MLFQDFSEYVRRVEIREVKKPTEHVFYKSYPASGYSGGNTYFKVHKGSPSKTCEEYKTQYEEGEKCTFHISPEDCPIFIEYIDEWNGSKDMYVFLTPEQHQQWEKERREYEQLKEEEKEKEKEKEEKERETRFLSFLKKEIGIEVEDATMYLLSLHCSSEMDESEKTYYFSSDDIEIVIATDHYSNGCNWDFTVDATVIAKKLQKKFSIHYRKYHECEWIEVGFARRSELWQGEEEIVEGNEDLLFLVDYIEYMY